VTAAAAEAVSRDRSERSAHRVVVALAGRHAEPHREREATRAK